MRINFNREEGWAEYADIRIEEGRRGGGLFFPMCRALIAAGIEDGAAEFFDERGVHCFTIRSILRGAGMAVSETESGLRFIPWKPFEWKVAA